jgi:outer membrane protein assembly factor BamC
MHAMKHNLLSRVGIVAVLVNLSACTYIKTMFPDKERDYQYTTEIAPLTLPADLNGKAIVPVVKVAAPVTEVAEIEKPDEALPNRTPEPAESESAVEHKSIQVELVKSEQGQNRLRIAAPVAQAWRMVGKSLSRKSVEVIKRNQEEKSYVVQFNPDEKKVEDGSIWDELAFMFHGFDTADKEYFLELEEINEQVTEVLVTDKEQQSSVGDGPGLNLLTLIRDAIKADLIGK